MSARERLNRVLEATGHAAKKSLGQNFLVSDTVIDRILEEAKRTHATSIIEVGPGPGALTEGLRAFGVPLTLIELDRTMAAYWRDQGLTVIEADALQLDWSPFAGQPGTVLVSNLPYQISSSIVIDRCLALDVDAMILMFQKEVAQRIRATSSAEDYGLLSVIAQTFWTITMVSEAGPRDFQPPPRVASRVLAFRLKTEKEGGRNWNAVDRKRFLGFTKAAFAQRRKLLKSNLSAWMGQRQVGTENLLAKLEAFGLKETARAEELTPPRFVELYEHLDRSGKS